jgi:4-amino-4-deoxy-L-arabinose transferase-like glycosyltransferase
MESPRPNATIEENRLRLGDFALLLLLCALLYGFSLFQIRVFSTHETVHSLNVREMFRSGEFLIPTYGGRPWLERPPLPHWITGAFAALAGDFDHEWAMRLGSIFCATLAVLIFAWTIAGCLGRTIGAMSGAILATTREFSSYAIAPEADIFLASTVTIIGSLFLRIQFVAKLDEGRTLPFGGRPAVIVLFFLLLGLTNWMKGPLFGMIFVLLPMAGYYTWNRDGRGLRPFAWFWGVILVGVLGAAWPVIAYRRYPDIVDLWLVDYGVRWNSGYIGEPFWYYFVNQPWSLFPWSIPVLIGLAVTAKMVHRGASLPLRYLWCWALLPVLFFSLFKGKHHHYLLSCLAPASALGAIGAVALWRRVREQPKWLRTPWNPVLLLGIPGTVLVILIRHKIPGPEWVSWLLAAGWPAVLALSWYVSCRRNGRMAFVGACAIIIAVDYLFYVHRSRYLDAYEGDQVFVLAAKALPADGRPLLVIGDKHPLTSSWLLYYLGEKTQLLHNITFLRDDRLTVPEAYVICRHFDGPLLAEFGDAEEILQSAQTRGEASPADRWTLYLLRFHPHLARMPGNVRISPLQATGRAFGPFLGQELAGERGIH